MTKHILKGVDGFIKPGNNLFYFVPEKIKIVKGWNGREDFSDLDDLKNSIREIGVQDPLIVWKSPESIIELIAGERRLRSVLELNKEGCSIKSVPVIVRSSRINKIDLYIESITADTGKPLLPIEEANSFKRLIAWGLTRNEISIKCGRSLSHVRNRLELSDAGPAVKKAVQEKEITAGSAQKIVKESHGSIETQERKLEEVKTEPKKKVEPEPGKIKEPEKPTRFKNKHLEYDCKMILFLMWHSVVNGQFNSKSFVGDTSLDLKSALFGEHGEGQFNSEYDAWVKTRGEK